MGPLAKAALVVGVLLAAGCGSGTGGGDAVEPPAQPRYDLEITYWPDGRDGESRTATLTCEPDGGTHPDPAKACVALLEHPEALHPVPLDMACTEIYGGDQVATVTGAGLKAKFSRANGCEIARWDALAPLLELPA
ncbi:MAG TPA: SSI family serine proteinase inhibitor [Gaiellaceae bacterium]|nr:SSI family serine proteinase inhibitor [Gaiellaceae bacterium]